MRLRRIGALLAGLAWVAPVGTRLASAQSTRPVRETRGAILVHDVVAGCFLIEEREDKWWLDGETYRCGERSLSRARVEEIRATLLAAPETVEGVLASVGVTPDSVAAHRDEILAAAMPYSWKTSAQWPGAAGRGEVPVLPPELEWLLGYEANARRARSKLVDRGLASLDTMIFQVTLPGDPTIVARSESQSGWMLPWTIEAGGRTWTSPDVRVSRALLELAAPDGPCRATLDGEAYWTDGFLPRSAASGAPSARSSTRRCRRKAYVQLTGYASVLRRFEIVEVLTGSVNMLPEAMQFDLDARQPALVDTVRWFNLLEDGKLTSTWEDFERAIASVHQAASRHAWLAEWKHAGPGRFLMAEVAGHERHADRFADDFVAPAWRHAGLPGEPAMRLHLMLDGESIGSVWLADDDARALIVRARPDKERVTKHWFDELDVSFHPKTPTYALVEDGQARTANDSSTSLRPRGARDAAILAEREPTASPGVHRIERVRKVSGS